MLLGWVPFPAPVCSFDLPGFGPQPDPALMLAQRSLHPAVFDYAEPFGPPPDPSLTVLPSRCAAAVELLQCISDLTNAAASAVRSTALAREDPALADPRTVEELASLWMVLSTAVAAVPVCLLPTDMAGLAVSSRREQHLVHSWCINGVLQDVYIDTCSPVCVVNAACIDPVKLRRLREYWPPDRCW